MRVSHLYCKNMLASEGHVAAAAKTEAATTQGVAMRDASWLHSLTQLHELKKAALIANVDYEAQKHALLHALEAVPGGALVQLSHAKHARDAQLIAHEDYEIVKARVLYQLARGGTALTQAANLAMPPAPPRRIATPARPALAPVNHTRTGARTPKPNADGTNDWGEPLVHVANTRERKAPAGLLAHLVTPHGLTLAESAPRMRAERMAYYRSLRGSGMTDWMYPLLGRRAPQANGPPSYDVDERVPLAKLDKIAAKEAGERQAWRPGINRRRRALIVAAGMAAVPCGGHECKRAGADALAVAAMLSRIYSFRLGDVHDEVRILTDVPLVMTGAVTSLLKFNERLCVQPADAANLRKALEWLGDTSRGDVGVLYYSGISSRIPDSSAALGSMAIAAAGDWAASDDMGNVGGVPAGITEADVRTLAHKYCSSACELLLIFDCPFADAFDFDADGRVPGDFRAPPGAFGGGLELAKGGKANQVGRYMPPSLNPAKLVRGKGTDRAENLRAFGDEPGSCSLFSLAYPTYGDPPVAVNHASPLTAPLLSILSKRESQALMLGGTSTHPRVQELAAEIAREMDRKLVLPQHGRRASDALRVFSVGRAHGASIEERRIFEGLHRGQGPREDADVSAARHEMQRALAMLRTVDLNELELMDDWDDPEASPRTRAAQFSPLQQVGIAYDEDANALSEEDELAAARRELGAFLAHTGKSPAMPSDENDAALVIQKNYRGLSARREAARREMQSFLAGTTTGRSNESKRETPAAPMVREAPKPPPSRAPPEPYAPASYSEEHARAATAIQAAQRGRAARSQVAQLQAIDPSPTEELAALEAKAKANRLLTDEELDRMRDLRGVNTEPPSAEEELAALEAKAKANRLLTDEEIDRMRNLRATTTDSRQIPDAELKARSDESRRNQESAAARTIQRHARGRIARKEASRLRTSKSEDESAAREAQRTSNAATRIQAQYRGMKGRSAASSAREQRRVEQADREAASAKTIQRHARGRQARKQASQLRAAKEANAVVASGAPAEAEVGDSIDYHDLDESVDATPMVATGEGAAVDHDDAMTDQIDYDDVEDDDVLMGTLPPGAQLPPP